MKSARQSAASRLLAGWIRLVRRFAAAVLILAALATAGAAYYAATHLGMKNEINKIWLKKRIGKR